MDFVEAARASGAGPFTIMRVHMLGMCWDRSSSTPTGLISVSMIFGRRPLVPWPRHKAAGGRNGIDADTLRTAIYVNPLRGGAAGRDELCFGSICFNLAKRRHAQRDGYQEN